MTTTAGTDLRISFSLIRAPHAFELHHRHVELTWALYPTLTALFRMSRFAQTLIPTEVRQ